MKTKKKPADTPAAMPITTAKSDYNRETKKVSIYFSLWNCFTAKEINKCLFEYEYLGSVGVQQQNRKMLRTPVTHEHPPVHFVGVDW